jgi:nicotinamidase-related amidase
LQRKEIYYTHGNIQAESLKILESANLFDKSKRIPFSFEDCVLLVLDMQNYFLKEESNAFIPSAPAIIPGINSAINTFKSFGLPVIYTKHIDVRDSVMLRWWKNSISVDDIYSGIIFEGDVIVKNYYDAFDGTNLESVLKSKNIKRILICGVMGNLCCEHTARSAFLKGFEVFYSVDGTACYNREFHKATVLNLSFGYAVPVLIHKIIYNS